MDILHWKPGYVGDFGKIMKFGSKPKKVFFPYKSTTNDFDHKWENLSEKLSQKWFLASRFLYLVRVLKTFYSSSEWVGYCMSYSVWWSVNILDVIFGLLELDVRHPISARDCWRIVFRFGRDSFVCSVIKFD